MSAKRSTISATLIKGRRELAAAIGVTTNGLIGMEARGLPIHKKGNGSTSDPNQYFLRDVLAWLVRDRERQGGRRWAGCDLDAEPLGTDGVMYHTVMGGIGYAIRKAVTAKRFTGKDFMFAYSFVAYEFVRNAGCENEEYLSKIAQLGQEAK